MQRRQFEGRAGSKRNDRKREMTSHQAVVRTVAAIKSALDSLTIGETGRAVTVLHQVIEVFDDSQLASNQEVWQLFDPFLSVAAVCAAKASEADGAAMQLYAKAVHLKLGRIRP
jgi:hypothetical protein